MIEPKYDINLNDQITVFERSGLIKELKRIMNRLNHRDFESIYPFFNDFIKEIDIIIRNLLEKSTSEVLICYGKNSELSKILLNHNLSKLKENNRNKVDYKTINFNAFINDKEENILNQLCEFFDLDSEKRTFESSCRAIENYFRYFENDEDLDKDYKLLDPVTLKNINKKKISKTIYVIFYENVEYLFHKQKQILFYTILELVNNSKNIIFCGTTSNYNLTVLMEKRIKSRFSQKTFFLDLLNMKDIESTLEYLFCYENESNFISQNTALYQIIKNTKFYKYYIEKCYDFGVSIKEFYFNLRVFVSNLLREVSKTTSPTQNISISEIDSLIQRLTRSLAYINISNLEYLYKLPKYHISVLACILKTVSKHKEKIIISMMYDEYIRFSRRNDIKPMKLELFKKIVEDLCVFGIIYPKRDDKYIFTYELKYNSSEIKTAIINLERFNNFETGLKAYLNDVF